MDQPPASSPASPSASNVRRALGQIVVARALWYVKPGEAQFKTERLEPPGPGEVRIQTHFSLISRGTERLVAFGEVPESEWQTMRAPMQAGQFPFPVKYGYSAAGEVMEGPGALIGKTVFCLHPHQDYFRAPEAMVHVVPDGIPAQRAVLAANMETALNGPGDKVLVIGAGIVGLLTAYLARQIAGTDVTIADIEPGRADLAAKLGLSFALPGNAPADNHVVFHTSATAAGLQTAIDNAAFEGRIVEMSWYGTKPVSVALGRAFHSRRLQLISSQVGHVAPSRRGHVSHRDRLGLALRLLADPALDALVKDTIAFDEVPERLTQLLGPSTSGHSPGIRYAAAPVIRYAAAPVIRYDAAPVIRYAEA
jgi:NADPH:quinone reductase-like Zn-dependent oxidoreductase